MTGPSTGVCTSFTAFERVRTGDCRIDEANRSCRVSSRTGGITHGSVMVSDHSRSNIHLVRSGIERIENDRVTRSVSCCDVRSKTATSAEADTTPTSTQSEWNWRKILSVVADIMVCLMLLKFVLSWWNHYRAGRINSEASYFARFGRACASGDAHAIDIALLTWLD